LRIPLPLGTYPDISRRDLVPSWSPRAVRPTLENGRQYPVRYRI